MTEPIYEYDDVLEVINADTPAAFEIVKMRGLLIYKIRKYVRDKKLSHLDAAKTLGVSKVKMSRILNAKTYLLKLEDLIEMAVNAEIEFSLEHKPKTA
ncbi:MAG: helix-turn-helix domain-containing protein [Caulobacterales bacterium]|nr:helix-turn-helix domain-containing protein [Caulobacterales bacterium]